MHVPCEQTSLVLHAVPQLPQLERSVFVSTQVPLTQACVKHGSPLPVQVVWVASGPQFPAASQVLHSAHAIGPETQWPWPSQASPTVQALPSPLLTWSAKNTTVLSRLMSQLV